MRPGIFVRIIIAVLGVVFAFLLLPLIAQAFELGVSGPVMQIMKLCIAAIGVFYILWGRNPTWS